MKEERIHEAYRYGGRFVTSCGLHVEYLRCADNDWTVFITRNGDVVACSLEIRLDFGNLPKAEARRIAMETAKSVEAHAFKQHVIHTTPTKTSPTKATAVRLEM